MDNERRPPVTRSRGDAPGRPAQLNAVVTGRPETARHVSARADAAAAGDSLPPHRPAGPAAEARVPGCGQASGMRQAAGGGDDSRDAGARRPDLRMEDGRPMAGAAGSEETQIAGKNTSPLHASINLQITPDR